MSHSKAPQAPALTGTQFENSMRTGFSAALKSTPKHSLITSMAVRGLKSAAGIADLKTYRTQQP